MVPAGLERSFYVWVASLLFIAVCALWQPWPASSGDVDGAARGVLWLLQVFGAWLTLRSAAIIDIWDLAGLRQARGVSRPSADRVQERSAPTGGSATRFTRGWFLLVFATSPMTGDTACCSP